MNDEKKLAVFVNKNTKEKVEIEYKKIKLGVPRLERDKNPVTGKIKLKNELENSQHEIVIDFFKSIESKNTFFLTGVDCFIELSFEDETKSTHIKGYGFCSSYVDSIHHACFEFGEILWTEQCNGHIKTILEKNKNKLVIHNQVIYQKNKNKRKRKNSKSKTKSIKKSNKSSSI